MGAGEGRDSRTSYTWKNLALDGCFDILKEVSNLCGANQAPIPGIEEPCCQCLHFVSWSGPHP